MCGIVGIISKQQAGLFESDFNVFSQLLWADQIRGQDGTGLFFNTEAGASSLRVPGPPGSLFANKLYQKTKARAIKEGDFLIGHNRAATKGKVDTNNTHPFVVKNLVGVHNGTLFNHRSLLADVESDSNAIYIHMEKHGYKDTLKVLDGAFALAWFDCSDNKLRVVRNVERPLNIIECKNTWIISSEEGLGKWIAERNNWEIVGTKPVETGVVYSLSLEKKWEWEEEKVEFRKWGTQTKGVDTSTKWVPPKNVETESTTDKPREHLAWGAKVEFTPSSKKEGYGLESSIFYDDKRKNHFLHGDVVGGKFEYVKVYGSMAWLTELEKHEKLTGVVVNTHFGGKKAVTYCVSNVQEVKEEKREYNKVITPPVAVWGQTKNTVECGFCLTMFQKEDGHLCETGSGGPEWICSECWAKFNGGSSIIQ